MNKSLFFELVFAILVSSVVGYKCRKGFGLDARTIRRTGESYFRDKVAMGLIASFFTMIITMFVFLLLPSRGEIAGPLIFIDWIGVSFVCSYFFVRQVIRVDLPRSHSELSKAGLFLLFTVIFAFGILILYGLICTDF